MKYIVEGFAITNRLRFLDGRIKDNIMGGGSFYAYTAVRMCTDDCLYISSVGDDFDEYYGEWFKNNHCSKDGLFVQLKKTVFNELKYFPDGSYIEYSIYGKKYTDEELYNIRKSGIAYLKDEDPEEEKNRLVDIDKWAKFMDDAKGLYTSQPLNEHNREVLTKHKVNGCKIMWEIPSTGVETVSKIYDEKGIEGVKDYLKVIDIFSINRHECRDIFKVKTDEEIIPLLKKLNISTYYRVGTEGAYMIVDNKEYFVPMISTTDKDKEIDPTGCGNTSTGAVMWAHIEGYDPLMTCIIGNVVASYNVRQYGPYLDMSEETRKEMLNISKEIYDKISEGKYE